ncbi:MAG TPA: hypothetical protein ENI73_07830 [Spirochaetes bacterium]|nr:hypothetical protein [Spirochaetota bacterium]
MSISGDQLVAHTKQRCEEDFTFFVRYFFKMLKGKKFLFSDHHYVICKKLMQVHRGEVPYLVVNVPPRYSKTELVIKMFSAWCYAINPACEFIHLSYSDSLALDNSDTIKQIIKSTEFKQLWPNVKIRPNKDSKKSWETSEGGNFYATASGGSVTGFGAGKVDDFIDDNGFGGCILIDDPLKPDDAYSETKRTFVNRRWDETIKSRFNSTRTPCIVVMQRLFHEDFCDMLEKDPEYDFELLVLPAIIDEGSKQERALWESKHDLERLHLMKSKNSYMFAAQMQQRPSPLGGGLIRGEWFGRYTVVPKLKYRACFGDTAQKKKEANDYQVAVCFGLGDDGYLYVIDLLREKFEAYELEQRFPDFWAKQKSFNNGRLRYFGIEDKSSGTELIQKMQKKITPKIPVKAIPRHIDKLTRVMDVQGYIEAGYVKIPESASWVNDFIAECEAFTADDTHKHDDQIDPLCDAISNMLHNNVVSIKDML